MLIPRTTPGSVAAGTSAGPARTDARHWPSTPRRQQLPFYPQQWKDHTLPSNCKEGSSGKCSYLSWKWSTAVDLTAQLWM